MMIGLGYIYSRWFVVDKSAGQDAGSSTPRLVWLAQGVRIKNHKKTLTWRIWSRAPGDSTLLRHTEGESPCPVCSVPRESTAGTFTLPPKRNTTVDMLSALCVLSSLLRLVCFMLSCFKFTVSNYYHQLSLASFTSPCLCLYINMCTHMFYIHTCDTYRCAHMHTLYVSVHTHEYMIRTYVFQLLHMYLFGRMISLHCCLFLFGNLL